MSCSSSSASATHPEQHDDPITIDEVSVNGVTITPEEIAREVQYHPANSPEEGVQAAAEALVIHQLLIQKARELGLWSNDCSEEDVISKLLQQQAVAPQASEAECERYFTANRNTFCTSPLMEVSHILISAAPEDFQQRDQAKQQARQLIETLQQSPEQFVALAKEFSDCPSRETDGNLGQLSSGQTTPEFEQQVFPLGKGLAKHPIETRYGFHVVLVHQKIEGNPLPYEQVKDRIAEYLNEASQRKTISQYIHILISEATIEGINMGIEGSPLLQ
ncbi:MAG: peptidylprolyl isomerase [Porticoccaceae bacterium]|nr:peptidylprolyl isomerase [Pseudomonadales bacterium]MCP5173236.1 peptidylprolyl isomerase [Pseudomonadales bacterium]